MKRNVCLIAAIVLIFMCACSGKNDIYRATDSVQTKKQESSLETDDKINARIEMADGGVIELELYPDIAPITVDNFVKLANSGFYDGLIFHRVIEGFMIQGGGFTADMQQKKTESIKGEFSANGVENNLKHERGVISMARTNVMDSASSQFFIMHKDAPHLDGQYAAFGKVISGMETVDSIATAKTAAGDVPITQQVIKTIQIV